MPPSPHFRNRNRNRSLNLNLNLSRNLCLSRQHRRHYPRWHRRHCKPMQACTA
jgi:hypothetical protein